MLRILASVLAAATALAHSGLGTFDTLKPVMANPDLAQMVRGTIAACWHFLGLFMAASAYVFWVKHHPATSVIALLWIAFGIIFLLVGAATSGILSLPQWIALIPAGVLACVALNQEAADT